MSLSPTQLLARTKAKIQKEGELLTVTRRSSTGGGTPTTQSIYFLPETQASPGGTIGVEAANNVAEPNEYDFVCAGDQDVQQVIDRISYSGSVYQVQNINPTRKSGVSIALHCFAIRVSG